MGLVHIFCRWWHGNKRGLIEALDRIRSQISQKFAIFSAASTFWHRARLFENRCACVRELYDSRKGTSGSQSVTPRQPFRTMAWHLNVAAKLCAALGSHFFDSDSKFETSFEINNRLLKSRYNNVSSRM